eukprot:3099061-Rhodomonas_salina.1
MGFDFALLQAWLSSSSDSLRLSRALALVASPIMLRIRYHMSSTAQLRAIVPHIRYYMSGTALEQDMHTVSLREKLELVIAFNTVVQPHGLKPTYSHKQMFHTETVGSMVLLCGDRYCDGVCWCMRCPVLLMYGAMR